MVAPIMHLVVAQQQHWTKRLSNQDCAEAQAFFHLFESCFVYMTSTHAYETGVTGRKFRWIPHCRHLHDCETEDERVKNSTAPYLSWSYVWTIPAVLVVHGIIDHVSTQRYFLNVTIRFETWSATNYVHRFYMKSHVSSFRENCSTNG